MSKIKVLTPAEAQKIAAGEVVERPANIVKELLENSIDAGATAITLYIENGGKSLIRIIDNGCGMDKSDAILSIQHHATSKITSIDDLQSIATFGFRGEALSSICSVSKVTLITQENHAETGIKLTIEAGTIVEEEVIASAIGTDITIADLFFNVPARKKFLKTRETEWNAINQLFLAFALAYPSIHFKLYHDNKLIFNIPSVSELPLRISQLYESSFTDSLLNFREHDPRANVMITGALSNPHYHRYDRNRVFIFVNKRWIKNYKLSHAIMKGYQNILPTEKYPAVILFISLNSEAVDINIHPRKEEVQFLHPKIIESTIQTCIKKTLDSYVEKNLHIGARNSIKSIPTIPYITAQEWTSSKDTVTSIPKDELSFLEILDESFSKHSEFSLPQKETITQQPIITKPIELKTKALEYRLIGQTLATYILLETESGLTIIDQHAAHERILYERIRSNFSSAPKIKLMFPHIISLLASDITAIIPYFDLFSSFGFAIEELSATELVIRETPIYIKNQNIDDIIKQSVGWIHEFEMLEDNQLRELIQEKIHAQLSCKAAVKAGDELSSESMHELIKDLYTIENRFTCPHGRPTIWTLSTSEIEKKFKRDYR